MLSLYDNPVVTDKHPCYKIYIKTSAYIYMLTILVYK